MMKPSKKGMGVKQRPRSLTAKDFKKAIWNFQKYRCFYMTSNIRLGRKGVTVTTMLAHNNAVLMI
jgi:hypothetical protein